jgi:phenylacetate-CoA ligase
MIKKIINQIKNFYYIIPPSYRPGPFDEIKSFLDTSEFWSEKQHIQYQTMQMEKLIQHAYKNVPYYQKIFKQRGLTPKDFGSVEDLQKLPILTKEIVRNNIDDLLAVNYKRYQLMRSSTGGSEGRPLKFYEQRFFSEIKELAFIYKLWERVGFNPNDKKAVLRGPVIDRKRKLKYDPIRKELLLSSYHTDDEHLYEFYSEILKRKIKFLHAHISAALTFANFIIKNNLKLSLKAVLGASENVFPAHRELIQQAFSTRLFTFYGLSEHVVMAGECEFSNSYHIFPQYGITELIDENGKEINSYGSVGEIVGTGFNNYIIPFIRYKTGDLAQFTKLECECGRKYKTFKNIEGRSNEYIYTLDGRKITTTGLIFGRKLKAYQNIKAIQIYQDKVGIIELRIVKKSKYSKRDENELREAIKKAVNSGIIINYKYLDKISLTNQGKHKNVIQKIKL